MKKPYITQEDLNNLLDDVYHGKDANCDDENYYLLDNSMYIKTGVNMLEKSIQYANRVISRAFIAGMEFAEQKIKKENQKERENQEF